MDHVPAIRPFLQFEAGEPVLEAHALIVRALVPEYHQIRNRDPSQPFVKERL
jgi:hypothetical protein